jgi:hypothetical protein
MENYDSRSPNRDQDEAEKPKKEPGSTAAGLIAGLGDTEGTEEGRSERLKESHGLMVRGWDGGVAIFSAVP